MPKGLKRTQRWIALARDKRIRLEAFVGAARKSHLWWLFTFLFVAAVGTGYYGLDHGLGTAAELIMFLVVGLCSCIPGRRDHTRLDGA